MQSATVSSFALWSKETEYLQADDTYSNTSFNAQKFDGGQHSKTKSTDHLLNMTEVP